MKTWMLFLLGCFAIVILCTVNCQEMPPINEESLVMIFVGGMFGLVTLAMCCGGSGYLEYD